MVKKLILLFQILPLLLFSAEFSASVNRNKVKAGERFALKLSLSGANAKQGPDISALPPTLVVGSQKQGNQVVINNGQFLLFFTWEYVMVAQQEGVVEIPSFTLDTSAGVLTTNPLSIDVENASTASTAIPNDQVDLSDVKITAEINKKDPYKNEPVVYTIRLHTKKELVNLNLSKVEIEDAYVEQSGEHKIYKKILDGASVDVLEFTYLITPLKPGVLKISPSTIQGSIPVRRTLSGSFFEDEFDPFAMMQGLFQLKPFAVSTEEINLNVQPPVSGVNPWLPAKDLVFEETFDENQTLKVGEPFTRSIKIKAEGAQSNQLAGIENLISTNENFKVYAEKPVLSNEVNENGVNGYRVENYTLIPQKAGTLSLPEISLQWWDVNKKVKGMAKIPSRELAILPAVPGQNIVEGILTPEEDVSYFYYYLIAFGFVLHIIAAYFTAVFIRKNRVLTTAKKDNVQDNKPDKQEKLPDLNPT